MSNSSVPTPTPTMAAGTPGTSRPTMAHRRKPEVNPFMARKPRRRPMPSGEQNAGNGPKPGSVQQPRQSAQSTAANGKSEGQAGAQSEEAYDEFPILISKTELERNMRYHGLKFQANQNPDGSVPDVNPFLTEQFTRPLRLHRRYARDKQEAVEQPDALSGVDDKERELYNARRAERQAEREANQALIAPTGNAAKKAQMKKKKNQKNVEDVYYDENDPKQQKAAQLRYEETRPWHLEDFDGKSVWVGAYQEPLSENGVLFQLEEGGFAMVPVERWYTFRATNRVSTMDSEQVEKHMAKKFRPSRWFLKTQDANDEASRQKIVARQGLLRTAGRTDREGERPQPKREAGEFYQADVDELDFEANDEFSDDDEGHIFGEEAEDAKEIEKKVRDEMREANLPSTGLKNDDKDWDEEDNKEKEERAKDRKMEKRLRRRIVKHEKKFEYDSDSDHPYSESSETDESEEGAEKAEEERKKKEEALKAALVNGGKSGASTQGTNTPSGRVEKRDPIRANAALGASLKRPGSPNFSDISGSESRKKAKGLNGRAMSPTSAPNGARALSPDAAKSHISRSTAGGYGSGSDTDTSRAGRSKIRIKSSTGSPHEGSPAGSPRASQPASRAQSSSRSGTPPVKFPTLDEVRAAIPPTGISINDLGKLFKTRVGKDQTFQFIALVKGVGKQDPASKLILPKPKEDAMDVET